MASSLPSPPSSQSPSLEPKEDSIPVSEKEEDGTLDPPLQETGVKNDTGTEQLSDRLDTLLESYLDMLDTYTRLREQLSQDFSAGFFALAQANRNSILGPGRRYGEEGYDKRMKALKRVHIVQSQSKSKGGGTSSETSTAGEDGRCTGSDANSKEVAQVGYESAGNGGSAERNVYQGSGAEGDTRLQGVYTPPTASVPPTAGQGLSQEQEGADADAGEGADADAERRSRLWHNGQSSSPSSSKHAACGIEHSGAPSVANTLSYNSYSTTSTLTSGREKKDAPSPESTPSSDEKTTVPTTSAQNISTSSTSSESKPSPNTNTNTKQKESKDPVRWYGILVAPALRQCQSHFHTSVSSTIPDLVSTMSALDSLEREIWRLRRELGVHGMYEDPEDVNNNHGDEDITTVMGAPDEEDVRQPRKGHGTSTSTSNTKRSPKTSTRRQSLLSPSAAAPEPRSRVLKLD
ncbi:hypothetical protein A1O1_08086 [Capronia coronata CBS 617.96]|uniref:Vacuolar ATPase assembly protein VMA22 n=1 Tax=Capronia coronata CBS 617.96 TaxID=1182541 RepID=W9XP81_9EURO|nr:uncharacterized protein A1O1_08086 [Capronia coronata CBS 617.96]EXJ82018.1 hypothetical protein A1O1_08086 [Capronia coronata CBS 617.96]